MASILASANPTQKPQDLIPNDWKALGISVLALDFDGVLAPHGETTPLPAMHNWLKNCLTHFPPEQIFILSNRPSPARIQYFNRTFPGIRFISGVQKKPYPDGLAQIIKIKQVAAHEVMLVDDRLLTGGLAACLAGTQVTYIRQPYIALAKRPIKELFFIILRSLEKRFIKRFSQ